MMVRCAYCHGTGENPIPFAGDKICHYCGGLGKQPALSPCPFCFGKKGKPLLLEMTEEDGGGFAVSCFGCSIQTFRRDTREQAAIVWNSRETKMTPLIGIADHDSSEITPLTKGGIRTRMMTDAERATMEMADVMKQWSNPCVREAQIAYQHRRFKP